MNENAACFFVGYIFQDLEPMQTCHCCRFIRLDERCKSRFTNAFAVVVRIWNVYVRRLRAIAEVVVQSGWKIFKYSACETQPPRGGFFWGVWGRCKLVIVAALFALMNVAKDM